LAEATVEMRVFDPEIFDFGVESILGLQNEEKVSNANGNYECKVSVELKEQSAPWPSNPGTEKLFGVWEEAAKLLGTSVFREERGGLSDGNAIWHTIPTIDGLGPYGAHSHCSERNPEEGKNQEFANRSSFVPKALLNTLAILKLIEKSTE